MAILSAIGLKEPYCTQSSFGHSECNRVKGGLSVENTSNIKAVGANVNSGKSIINGFVQPTMNIIKTETPVVITTIALKLEMFGFMQFYIQKVQLEWQTV